MSGTTGLLGKDPNLGTQATQHCGETFCVRIKGALHSTPSLPPLKERNGNWYSRKHLDYYLGLVGILFCFIFLR